MTSNMAAKKDLNEENPNYPSGGAPPQPFRVIVPYQSKRILTPRLVLEPISYEHIESICANTQKLIVAWQSMPEMESMLKYLMSRTADAPAVRQWMDSKRLTVSETDVFTYYFAVTLRNETPGQEDEPGEFIGTVGMNQVLPLPNVGYSIDANLWGQGYGSEAVKFFLEDWWSLPRSQAENGDSVPEKVYANVNKANVPSLKLLQKFGFKVYNEIELPDGTIICLLEAERM